MVWLLRRGAAERPRAVSGLWLSSERPQVFATIGFFVNIFSRNMLTRKFSKINDFGQKFTRFLTQLDSSYVQIFICSIQGLRTILASYIQVRTDHLQMCHNNFYLELFQSSSTPEYFSRKLNLNFHLKKESLQKLH